MPEFKIGIYKVATGVRDGTQELPEIQIGETDVVHYVKVTSANLYAEDILFTAAITQGNSSLAFRGSADRWQPCLYAVSLATPREETTALEINGGPAHARIEITEMAVSHNLGTDQYSIALQLDVRIRQ